MKLFLGVSHGGMPSVPLICTDKVEEGFSVLFLGLAHLPLENPSADALVYSY